MTVATAHLRNSNVLGRNFCRVGFAFSIQLPTAPRKQPELQQPELQQTELPAS